MLSDSLFEATCLIWKAKTEYDYSADHKEAMIAAMVELYYIVYQLDNMKTDQKLSKEDFVGIVTRTWNNSDRLGTDPSEEGLVA